ncbi:MAG: glycosyltransferase family 39 protein [Clostridiales bacterium]|nr:glycosyltransferase family 39 protein [Clostridiales bacterium]
MAGQPKKVTRFVLLFLFFAVLFLMRFIHLGADAPKDLDPLSPGYICDPGNYAFNARLKILTGEWKIDDWALNYIYITPIPHYITYVVFRLFGVGIAQMNVVPVLFSSLVLVLVFFILKRIVSGGFALLGVLLLGASYEFTMFSRVANRIMPMLFFACLTFYLLMIAEKKKPVYYFLAGIFCFISFTAKAIFLLVFPAVVLGLLLYTFFQRGKGLITMLKSTGLFGLGIAVIFAPWVFLLYLPNLKLFRDISADNIRRLTPGRLYWVIRNFWERPLYHWFEEPLLTTVTVVFLLFLAYAAFRKPRQVPLLGWISAIWIVSNYAYLSCVYYRPLRHDLPLLLPSIFLTTLALYQFSRAQRIQKPEKIPFPFYVFFFPWAFYTFTDIFLWRKRLPSFPAMEASTIRFLVISLAATVLVAVFLKVMPRRFQIPLPALLRWVFIGGVVAVYLFLNLKPYFAWAIAPRYDVRDISRDLGRAFEKMSIGGLSAPLMVMENQHIGHGYDYYIHERRDFLDTYKVTHLFLIPYFKEGRFYWEYYSEAMKRARVIARFPLWKTHFELWDLHPPSSAEEKKDETVYEGEFFYWGTGIPRYDSEASGKYARVMEGTPNNKIELGQIFYQPGEYEVFFFLKTGSDSPPPGTIARVEVYEATKGRTLGSRKISGRDFSGPREYRSFRLPLTLEDQTELGLRVLSKGNVVLYVDKVVIRKTRRNSPSVSGAGDDKLRRQEAR